MSPVPRPCELLFHSYMNMIEHLLLLISGKETVRCHFTEMLKKYSVAFSPQANNIDRATAACRRS
jgi:hypothetical protein